MNETQKPKYLCRMDDDCLKDIRRLLEDGLENTDWKCVEEAIDIIRDVQNDFDDEFETEE